MFNVDEAEQIWTGDPTGNHCNREFLFDVFCMSGFQHGDGRSLCCAFFCHIGYDVTSLAFCDAIVVFSRVQKV